MKTLVLSPRVIKMAEAYKDAGSGQMWGPLLPYAPRTKGLLSPRQPELMKISAGETFESYVAKMAPGYDVIVPTLGAGEYYARIWRTGAEIEDSGEAVPRVEDTP